MPVNISKFNIIEENRQPQPIGSKSTSIPVDTLLTPKKPIIQTNDEIFFLAPRLVEKSWGGLSAKKFDYTDDETKKYGISVLINGSRMNYSYLKEEDDKNSSFFDFYECNRKYFDNCNIDEYPLCVNMVDTNQHLPVKIHPYRRVTQTQPNGVKEKIIYVVSTEPKTDFVYGITTNNMEEIKKFIANERYGRLLNRKRIKKGDVIYVPAGTLYGYRKSCTVIEIENNLDSVFTFYNYDGEVTDTESVIETKDALNSIFLPFNENIIPKISKFGKLNTHLFNVKIINTILYFGKYEFNDARWLQCVVVSGKALLNWKYHIKKGDIFVLNSDTKSMFLLGKIKIIVSYLPIIKGKQQKQA